MTKRNNHITCKFHRWLGKSLLLVWKRFPSQRGHDRMLCVHKDAFQTSQSVMFTLSSFGNRDCEPDGLSLCI